MCYSHSITRRLYTGGMLLHTSFVNHSTSPYLQSKEAGADDVLDISSCELSEVNETLKSIL